MSTSEAVTRKNLGAVPERRDGEGLEGAGAGQWGAFRRPDGPVWGAAAFQDVAFARMSLEGDQEVAACEGDFLNLEDILGVVWRGARDALHEVGGTITVPVRVIGVVGDAQDVVPVFPDVVVAVVVVVSGSVCSGQQTRREP